MKRIFAPLAACALLALAACQPERHTPRDFYAILPQLVRFVETDARQEAEGRPAEGPLYIHTNSFAGGGWQLTRQRLNPDTVFAAIGRADAQSAVPREALILEDSAGFGGRWVRGYGVLLHMNLMKWDAEEMTATVTSYTTDRRRFPTDICRRVWRVSFREAGEGRWELGERELRKACDDPD